jgi:alpha-beta hydrolase superfamily lysophospholipase
MVVKGIVRGSRRLLERALAFSLGVLLMLVVGGVYVLNARPDLEIWHTADLDEEFTAGSSVQNFADYLENEDRVFAQVQGDIYDQVDAEDRTLINRFNRGSHSDPTSYPKDWNRSFELPASSARAGVLLLHGLSDSPYSMRSLGDALHAEGLHVLGLRVPGHGLAPVGLTTTRWEDMAAAVRLAMRHLDETLHGKPLHIAGYSNGGALAVHYSLEALADDSLPRPSSIVLLSPEIGITRLAGLAVWQERLGHLLGLRKLRWNSISPEFDPYKYGSFAINAGKQAYELTLEIQTQITSLTASGAMQQFPPTIAFQSVTDATVSVSALVTGLFDRLPNNGSELVMFDINRSTDIELLLRQDPVDVLRPLLTDRSRDFSVTVVQNKNDTTLAVIARTVPAGSNDSVDTELGLRWPEGLYSLAHVSLPFAPDDPIYGGVGKGIAGQIRIGELALRGERGVLQVSASEMLRLRWNPFHSYLVERTVGWMSDGAQE